LIKFKKQNPENNPIDEIFHIICKFKYKQILTFGYGCQILALYYGCTIIKKITPNNVQKYCISLDRRFKINYQSSPFHNVTFNNTYTIFHSNYAEIKTISYVSNTFEDVGFKFMFKDHYGFLFRLSDMPCGIHILNNIIYNIIV
jgi:hypothetical protein